MNLQFIFWAAIEYASYIIGIFTPIVLLWWFFYLQRQSYYDELLEVFAGYTDPSSKTEMTETGGIHSGLIMNFRDVTAGFYRGEFDFRENLRTINEERFLSDGIHSFYCKMNHKIYIIKSRNPLKPKENRIYKGTLYIVHRLDIDFKNQKIEEFLVAEYDIMHYREMKVLEFTLNKTHKEEFLRTPRSFILHKSLGLGFEPYKNVREDIFRGFTRSDKNINKNSAQN